ncbi:nitroreductase family protein [Candidatus Bathyarchaeota archaeon]|nr:nitroreductase family protein [Candidatus Bathyarchaeota archaeon]
MKILELAKSRKTVRKFKEKEVPLDQVKKVLEVATQAPSGANYQGWRFIVISKPELKRKIRLASEAGETEFYKKVSGDWSDWLSDSKISSNKPYLEHAPTLIAVLGRNDVPYSSESVWLSIGYMLLALEELGLSTVTYTPSDVKLVEKELPIPNSYRLEAILPIGYSDDEKQKEPRENLDKILEIIK